MDRGQADMTSTTAGAGRPPRVRRAARAQPQAGASPSRPAHLLPVVVRALKAMAHPARLRMLAMLTRGELCVCQMTAVLALAASTVSGHLADLRAAGLVTERKAGKWVHYRLPDDPGLTTVIRDVLAMLAADGQAHSDAAAVARVRRIPVETLSANVSGASLALAIRKTGGAGTTPPRRSPTRPRAC